MSPYIAQERRYDAALHPETPGELNYAFCALAMRYMGTGEPQNYTILNDIMGAFSGAAQEFYRRVVVPFEDGRCEANGEVFQ